jgi:hypothetical protein
MRNPPWGRSFAAADFSRQIFETPREESVDRSRNYRFSIDKTSDRVLIEAACSALDVGGTKKIR